MRFMASVSRPIPLRHRLPNPPPIFVGRENEAACLRDAIERCPATVVCGIGGLGKTALVNHTMRRFFGAETARTMMIRLLPGQSAKGSLSEIVRALAAVSGVDEIEWSRLQADSDVMIAAAIDLAEDGDVWVVLDDAHHCEASTLGALLGSVARYARKARWIATSREIPALEDLPEQVIALGAIATGDLRTLAERCAPNLDAASLDRIASGAHGSPWQLRQALPGSVFPARDDVIAGVDEGSLDVLRALAVLEAPAPVEILARMTLTPEPRVLDSLERRGFIERSLAGLRLHDVARPMLRSRFAPEREVWVARATKALGADESADGATTLERLRLYLDDGRVSEANGLLVERYGALRVAGFLPHLSDLLRATEDATLARFRMRAIVDGADLEGASSLAEPGGRATEDRLLWARVLVMRGEFLKGADAARAALVDAPDDTKVELGLLEAKCAVNFGDVERARKRLETLEPKSEDQRAMRDVALANVMLKKGDDFPGALALATDVAHRHAALGPAARREVGEALVDHFIRSGNLREAMDAYGTYTRREDGGLRVHVSLSDLITQTTLAVQSGALAQTEELLTKFASFAERSPFLRSHFLRIDIKRRLTAGDLAGLEGAIDDFARAAVADGNGDTYAVSRSYRAWIAQLRATPIPEDSAMPLTSMTQALIVEIARQTHAVRRGEAVPWLATPPPAIFPAQIKIIALALAAQNALLLGDEESTLRLAGDAARLSVSEGWEPHEADAQCILCDAAIVFDREDLLAGAAARLGSLAERFPSQRFLGESRFARAVSPRDPPDPVILEELAAMPDVAPVAARRAQALLGGDPLLDLLDRAVLDAIRRRAAHFRVECLAGGPTSPWRAGWGMDESRTSVWTPERGLVSFASKPLFWRVLTTIADAGGRATKDDLATKAWSARDYHPLHDDKRMQVAMHKLRALIEEDPKRPTRLVTVADGYAFGDREPMRRVLRGTAVRPSR